MGWDLESGAVVTKAAAALASAAVDPTTYTNISAVGREMAIVSHFDDATAWLRDNWPRVSTLARTEHEQE